MVTDRTAARPGMRQGTSRRQTAGIGHRLLGLVLLLVATATIDAAQAPQDGYRLWLRYEPVSDSILLAEYRAALSRVIVPGESETMALVGDELRRGLRGLLGEGPRVSSGGDAGRGPGVLAATPADAPLIDSTSLAAALVDLGPDGYVIGRARVAGSDLVVVTANTDVGVLYGTFALLRHLQLRRPLAELSVRSAPAVELRLLNHWDNLDRTVERGYAGFSLWDWHKLPDYVSPRYRDYARANASLGINGTVLTNVNADATVLRPELLDKVAALADVFRPYGLRVYLTARFSAPMEIGGLPTADPLDPGVAAWWGAKANEIYHRIPDFGGFLVKANSEGQPGPQDFGRSHADGANMLADAVAPHGGVVMWRAFVYSDDEPADRVRQAYDEFEPLDGEFRDNVLVQVKNGPLDFQPREPFHPLFGAMPETPLMLELQVTKEYLGMATHMVYLGTLWEEVLESDTYAHGSGSTVARVVDGSLHHYPITGIAGVANTGTDRNWTGSHFNQANWFAFGRMAWDPSLSAERIAETWIRMTFSNDPAVVEPVKAMMMASREAAVNYMTPLGLAHLMARGHHYGPGPWVEGGPRADWTSVYYHRADSVGIGFDRTVTGSNAVAQYFPPVRDRYAHRETVPDSLLLWFHRVRWDERLDTGRTLWEELVHRYDEGVETVRWMRRTWATLEGAIDPRRFRDVRAFLAIQEDEAVWWRDACIAYFQSFSGMPIPEGYPPPAHSLDYYRGIITRTVP
jgi:alpha-glucuronidase